MRGGRDDAEAIAYLQQSGDRAERLGAPEEAIGHYQRALALLATVPETDVRTSQELALLIGLGQQFLASKGYAHPDVQRVHDRARSLCRRIGRSSQWVHALSGLGLFYSIRAEYGVARELYEQILDAAQSAGDLALISVADRVLGYLAAVTGEYAAARVHLERALAAFDPGWERDWLFRHPHDHAAVCHTFLSWSLWPLGYGDQALEHSRRALAGAEVSSRPINMAHALGLAAVFHAMRHDVATCRAKSEAAIAVSADKGFPFWEAMGMCTAAGRWVNREWWLKGWPSCVREWSLSGPAGPGNRIRAA